MKYGASHSDLDVALEQELPNGTRVLDSFAFRLLRNQGKYYSSEEKNFLAIAWSCEELRKNLRIRNLFNHKAMITTLKTRRDIKCYQSILSRSADGLLLFDFELNQIAGTKLGRVDYLSQQPPWEAPELSCIH